MLAPAQSDPGPTQTRAPAAQAAPLVPWLLLLALFAALFALPACATPAEAEGPLWADPGEVRLSPERAQVEVEIHNRSGTARPIREITLAGEDWDTLRFIDAELPRTIPAHDSVVLPLEVSVAAHRLEPGVYRAGQAELSFRSNNYSYAIPIVFVGEGSRGPTLAPLAAGGILILLFVALAWGPLRKALPPTRDPATTLGLAASFAALLTTLATLPLGFGLCGGRLGAGLGPRELAQCRGGELGGALGGGPLLAFEASPGLLWTLSMLALAAAFGAVARVRTRDLEVARLELTFAALAVLTFVLLIAALGFGLAPGGSSATAFVLAQTDAINLAQLPLPRWGAVAQPLGFALALALLVLAPRPARDRPPALTVLSRLEHLTWATLIATFYLGGPSLPGLSQQPVPLLNHGPQLALEMLCLAAKVALIVALAHGLRSFAPTHESARLHRLTHMVVPLALAQLVAILIWL